MDNIMKVQYVNLISDDNGEYMSTYIVSTDKKNNFRMKEGTMHA